jgi:hypothetical protein
MLKQYKTALFSLIAACQPQSQQPPKQEPPLTPISAPASQPRSLVVMPSTSSQPSTTSQPTTSSQPTSASQAALAPSSEPAQPTDFFFVEGAHPNPKIEEQLSCEPVDPDESCEITLRTTSLYSCLCVTSKDRGDRTGDDDQAYKASIYAIEGDNVRPITPDDLFEEEIKFPESEDFVSDNFNVSFDKGLKISFYPPSYVYEYGDPNKSLSGDKLTKLLRADSPPASVEKTRRLPRDFEASAPSALMVTALDKNPAPSSMPIVGTLQRGLRWTDSNGENTALLVVEKKMSKDNLKSTTNLYINLYTTNDDITTRTLSVFDKQEKCEKPNNIAGFLGDARVTDVDLDGVGELSFVYQLGCLDTPSELHPVKVFLVEGGAKYALRGDSSGAYKKDKTLEKVPAIFTEYLEWLSKKALTSQ